MAGGQLTWHVAADNGGTTVVFSGALDETCNIGGMPLLSGEVTFDLGGISRITSGGVTQWLRFLAGLGAETKLIYINCSITVVTQLNMVRGFRGGAEVRSFYAPYICAATDEEQELLLRPEDVPDPLHPPEFDSPAGKLSLNDLPTRYFAFLSRPSGSPR